jgi:hypothetical protein
MKAHILDIYNDFQRVSSVRYTYLGVITIPDTGTTNEWPQHLKGKIEI